MSTEEAYIQGKMAGIARWGHPNPYELGSALSDAFLLGKREGESIAMVDDLNDD